VTSDESRKTNPRLWIATGAVIMVVIAVWKYIDYQTQPPPPPTNVATPAPVP